VRRIADQRDVGLRLPMLIRRANKQRTPDHRHGFSEERVPQLTPSFKVRVEPCHTLVRTARLFEALPRGVIKRFQSGINQHAAIGLGSHADRSFASESD
jgi:hypothetical protein